MADYNTKLEDALLKDVRDKEYSANAAGALASDLGVTAFDYHVGYPAALSQNKKAQAAYDKMRESANVAWQQAAQMQQWGARDLAKDYQQTAVDRKEELALAFAALQQDMLPYIKLGGGSAAAKQTAAASSAKGRAAQTKIATALGRPVKKKPAGYQWAQGKGFVATAQQFGPAGPPPVAEEPSSGIPTWMLVVGGVGLVGGAVLLLR